MKKYTSKTLVEKTKINKVKSDAFNDLYRAELPDGQTIDLHAKSPAEVRKKLPEMVTTNIVLQNSYTVTDYKPE